MRILFRPRSNESPESESGPLLFQPLEARRTRLGPVLSSLALHAVIVASVTTLSQAWMASAPPKSNPSKFHYEVFVFRAPEPEPLELRQPMRRPESKPASRPARKPLPAKAESAALIAPVVPEPAPKVRRAFTPPAHIELPKVENALPNAPVILQTENRRVTLPKEISAPAVAAWARHFAPRREFVAPGRTQPKPVQPRLDAPPRLAVSNRASAPGALNVVLARSPNTNPVLPLPDSAVVPVRAPGGDNTEDAGELGTSKGEAAQLIVISPVTAAPGSMAEAPRGLRNVPPAGDPNSPGGKGASGGNGSAQASATGAAALASHGGGNANGNGNGNGSGNGTGGRGGPGGAERSLPGLSTAVITPEPRIRIANPPSGNFDVVVTQSALPPVLQELGISLTGSPVFTVYLKVGDDREWLLQYCLPVASKPVTNPYEIFVGAPTPIVPPYPLSTVIPKSIVGRHSTGSVAFHGRLTATGAFLNLELRPQKSALGLQILPMLEDWRFRPAAVDGRPSEVEILLVVPGQIN
jgi:hypothetical protein